MDLNQGAGAFFKTGRGGEGEGLLHRGREEGETKGGAIKREWAG